MRRFLGFLVLLTALALPVHAQDDESAQEAADKSRLESWLQDTLSGAGREVTVTGFQGALSSQATMERLEIADDDGVWLTLTDITLDWTRSAVLSGRIEINRLTAAEIDLARLPGSQAEDQVELPSAEASDFTLPDLPVSINIGEIAADSVTLGETVLGTAAELTLEGSARLADGEGQAKLTLERIDGQQGTFALSGAFSNATGELDLDLRLSEAQGGLAAGLIGLPGEPAIDLVVVGSDPISDFTANVLLSSDGEERLAGQVELAVERPDADAANAKSRTRVVVDLSGDLRPLFLDAYQPFFGGESLLHLEAARFQNGTLRVDDLFLRTNALELRGAGRVNPRGWPERLTLTGRLGAPDDTPIVLPIAGPEATLAGARLAFDYDSARGEGWTGTLDATDFTRDGTTVGDIALSGSGRLRPGGGDNPPSVAGDVILSVTDFIPRDAALAQAIGPVLSGSLSFSKGDEQPLRLSRIALSGSDYGLSGAMTLATELQQLNIVADLDLGLAAEDLSRFSEIAGQSLSGAANLGLTGQAALPNGPFDVEITGTTRDFSLGIERLDGLFAGENRLFIAADRDETGTRISEARLTGPGVEVSAQATLTSAATEIDVTLDLPDAARLDPTLAGALQATIDARESEGDWRVAARADGPGGLDAAVKATARTTRRGLGPFTATLTGSIDSLAPYSGLAGRALRGSADLEARLEGDLKTNALSLALSGDTRDIGLGLGDLDRLFAGAGSLSLEARRAEDGTLFIDAMTLSTPQLTAQATGTGQEGANRVAFEARLADMGIVVPNLSGAFAASGTATLTGESYLLDITGDGPAGMRLDVSGSVAGDASRGDLSVSGVAPLALANGFTSPNELSGIARFDLALNGPLGLEAVSGRVTSSDARVTLPALRIALGPIQTAVTLANGNARIEAAAPVSSGGRVDVAGPVSLNGGYDASLAVRLTGVGLTDPALYDTQVSGDLTVTGPLTGGARIAGQLNTGEVEIRIPSSGFGFSGGLEGLSHVNTPAPVRATLVRADKLGGGNGQGGSGAVYELDVTVNAPNRVFIRGRGLDAELGGSIRLTGTTADLVPVGNVSLIRGRLDLLGNRLDLTEASATLQGDFDPHIAVEALTTVEEVTIRIRLDGPATSPEVSFTSTPDLPEDEILSRLVFGRSVADISPLQALRLANGAATLAGSSGGGVMGSIRDNFNLADLDVATDENGSLAVRAGTYISENVYTGVELGADGSAEVTINLDLTPNLTARGSAGTDGNTSLGIYFEKDY